MASSIEVGRLAGMWGATDCTVEAAIVVESPSVVERSKR
jgi:hypothetical protein